MWAVVEGFFTSIGALVAFGSFTFYLIVLVVTGLIMTALAYEKGTRATLTLVVTVVLVLHFNTGLLTAARYVFDHVILFLVGAVIYLALGAGWSLAKWRAFHANLMESYTEGRRKFLKKHGLQSGTALTPELKEEWQRSLKDFTWLHLDPTGHPLPLDPYDYSRTIIMWMGHWPFSFLQTLLNDPVRKALRYIFTSLVSTYEKISRSSISSINDDILTQTDREQLQTAQAEKDAQAEEARSNIGRGPGNTPR